MRGFLQPYVRDPFCCYPQQRIPEQSFQRSAAAPPRNTREQEGKPVVGPLYLGCVLHIRALATLSLLYFTKASTKRGSRQCKLQDMVMETHKKSGGQNQDFQRPPEASPSLPNHVPVVPLAWISCLMVVTYMEVLNRGHQCLFLEVSRKLLVPLGGPHVMSRSIMSGDAEEGT